MNPQELDRLASDGVKAIKKGNLGTALLLLEQAFQKSRSDPFFAIGTAYELAAFHWGEYGNGVEAKSKYEFVMEAGKSALAMCGAVDKMEEVKTLGINIEYAQKSISQQMGYAAENLMLLSTSYEEFDKWTGELRRLAPSEPILSELGPSVNAGRENGTAWAEEMFSRACNYINIGHFGSSIHPASGACIVQLMLTHRKELRMRQDLWQRALMVYHAAIYEIGHKAEKLIRARKGETPDRETRSVLQYLIPYTQEYCDAFPYDAQISTLLDNAKAFAKKSQSGFAPTDASKASETPPARSYRTHILWIVGVALSIAVGGISYKTLPLSPKEEPYRGYIVALWGAATFAMWHFHMIRKKRTRPWVSCSTIGDECGRKGWKGISYCLQECCVDKSAHLHLIFRFVPSLSSDKTGVHIAVRAIVALTLPEVVKAIPQLTIADSGAGYTIGCGSGVYVPYYIIRRGARCSLNALQVGSEMDDNRCHVWIHPSITMPSLTQDISAQREIQEQIGKMFMEMFSAVRVTL